MSDIFNHPLRNYVRYRGVERVKDIPYGEGRFRLMDFYFDPEIAGNSREGLPVLLNVHGGGFVCGGKKYRSGIAKLFAKEGYFVVNTDYTLAPIGGFPTGGNDVIMAWKSLDLFKKRFPLDPKRVILTGDSAGGYWAAAAFAAAFSAEYRNMAGLDATPDIKPLALLTFCAPFNLLKCTEVRTPLNISEDIGDCLFGKKEKAEEYPAEAIDIVKAVRPDWAPVGIMAAKNDMFAGTQHEAMTKALTENGVENFVYVASEKGDAHCTHLYPFLPGSRLTIEKAKEFLSKVVNSAPETPDSDIRIQNQAVD